MKSKSAKSSKHTLVITFHNIQEFARIVEAAKVDQMALKSNLGGRYPNISMFLRQAAQEKTNRVLPRSAAPNAVKEGESC
jgi:hypothetical protein